MNRRQALQRIGIFPAAVRSLLGQLKDTTSFLSQYPAFDLHCHPDAFPHRGMPDYAGDQAFKKTTSDMRAADLSAIQERDPYPPPGNDA